MVILLCSNPCFNGSGTLTAYFVSFCMSVTYSVFATIILIC